MRCAFITSLLWFSLSAIGADSDFAKTIPCDIESASTTSLLTLPLSQGTTPLIAAYQQKGGRAITADTNVTAVLRFAPSATNALWVSVTNYTTSGSSYLFQMPSLGTNAVNWVYTIFYIRNGYTYWTGNGRLDIARSEAAGNPLSWSMPNDIATAINTHNLSTASHADKVTTNRTITINGAVGQLSSNLTFTVTASQTQQLYVATAGTVTGAQSNLIATAWQNPASVSDFTYTSDGKEITLVRYIGAGGSVIIPDMINGLNVTTLGDYAFNSGAPDYIGDPITSISGANNLKTIGNYAFRTCESLTSISIPSSVSIGQYSFYGCFLLKKIDLKKTERIGDFCFFGCTGLTRIDFHSITNIGNSAFYDCDSLTGVYFSTDKPTENGDIYLDIPANQVTNFVTSSTATGWGATFGGMPVVRMPVESERVNAGTVISITSNTTGTNSAGFFMGDGSLLTGLPSASSSPLAWTPIETVASASVATATVTTAKSIYSFTTATAISYTNDLSLLALNCGTNYEWEAWINYTDTNALASSTWDPRIDWQTGVPDLTVTGLYKFAMSTACGTRIQVRQLYPTVYPVSRMRWIANGTDTVGAFATIPASATATSGVSFYIPIGDVGSQYYFVSQRIINMGTSNFVVNARTHRAANELRANGVDQYSITNDATGNMLLKFIIPPGESTSGGLGRHILTYWFEPITYVPAVQIRYSTSLIRFATEEEIKAYKAGKRDF